MEDDKLAIEEARRAAQHELVKSQVEGEVNAEISERAAAKATRDESRKIDHVAGDAFSVGVVGGAKQRRLRAVHRSGQQSVLRTVSRDRCEPKHRRWTYAA